MVVDMMLMSVRDREQLFIGMNPQDWWGGKDTIEWIVIVLVFSKRCTWFYKGDDDRWYKPYIEDIAIKLEVMEL